MIGSSVVLQVCETLHTSSVEQKRRQLRSLEAQLAAKRNENATLALHLAGESCWALPYGKMILCFSSPLWPLCHANWDI